MAVDVTKPDRATFWYGCNMTRHGEIIRTAARLLQTLGIDVATAGGPGHCCGSPKDASARINEGMARRTIQAFNATGRDTVVTWCPSCHMNMQDSMAPVTPAQFETVHITQAVHARLETLRPLLRNPVPRRVLLHAHHGFDGRVPASRLVSDILSCIPGLHLVDHPLRVPGHMCSAIVAVPRALADAQRATLDAMAATGADTLCTIHHSCHRECVTLERHGVHVANWTHLLAESLGWPAEDGYKTVRNAGDPRAVIPPDRLDAVGDVAFERLIEPELRKAPAI